MTIIRDPSTGAGQKINDEGQAITRAIAESEIEHASSQGQAYVWQAPTADVAAGDTLLFIKNLGDTPLILDRVNFLGGNVASLYNILIGKATTTPDTINVTGRNLNQRFADAADVHAVSDEDTVADGTLMESIHVPVTVMLEWNLDGYILEKGVYIQINQVTESTAGGAAIIGHFENPS